MVTVKFCLIFIVQHVPAKLDDSALKSQQPSCTYTGADPPVPDITGLGIKRSAKAGKECGVRVESCWLRPNVGVPRGIVPSVSQVWSMCVSGHFFSGVPKREEAVWLATVLFA